MYVIINKYFFKIRKCKKKLTLLHEYLGSNEDQIVSRVSKELNNQKAEASFFHSVFI